MNAPITIHLQTATFNSRLQILSNLQTAIESHHVYKLPKDRNHTSDNKCVEVKNNKHVTELLISKNKGEFTNRIKSYF